MNRVRVEAARSLSVATFVDRVNASTQRVPHSGGLMRAGWNVVTERREHRCHAREVMAERRARPNDILRQARSAGPTDGSISH